jgi:hypothetical protein
MSWLNRSSDVTDGQAAAIAADTASRRSAWTAGTGRRSVGTARNTVVPPATGRPQPITARTHRS